MCPPSFCQRTQWLIYDFILVKYSLKFHLCGLEGHVNPAVVFSPESFNNILRCISWRTKVQSTCKFIFFRGCSFYNQTWRSHLSLINLPTVEQNVVTFFSFIACLPPNFLWECVASKYDEVDSRRHWKPLRWFSSNSFSLFLSLYSWQGVHECPRQLQAHIELHCTFFWSYLYMKAKCYRISFMFLLFKNKKKYGYTLTDNMFCIFFNM